MPRCFWELKLFFLDICFGLGATHGGTQGFLLGVHSEISTGWLKEPYKVTGIEVERSCAKA